MSTADTAEFQELAKGFIEAVSDAAKRQREGTSDAAAETLESARQSVAAAYGSYVTGVSKALARAVSSDGLHPFVLAAASIQLYQASQLAAGWGLSLRQEDASKAT